MAQPLASPVGVEARFTSPLEQSFEEQVERDRALLRLFDRATLAWSLLTVAILMTLVIPMRRTSPWLVLLSAYAISTRLGVLLARSALAVPQFATRLDDGDDETKRAARTVFDRHRPAFVKPLATGRTGASRTRELSYDDAAESARRRNIGARRRAGMIYLALWFAVTVIVAVILVSTGAGPTG